MRIFANLLNMPIYILVAILKLSLELKNFNVFQKTVIPCKKILPCAKGATKL